MRNKRIKKIRKNGYIFSISKKGNIVPKHRQIMSKIYRIEKWHHIHHINGNKTDNRTKNLMISCDMVQYQTRYDTGPKVRYQYGADTKKRQGLALSLKIG